MNSIDKIIKEFDLDYHEHLTMPTALQNQYPQLCMKPRNVLSLFCASTFLNYSLTKYIMTRQQYAETMIQVRNSILDFCLLRYQEGKDLLQDTAQYYKDYMNAVKGNGGILTIPSNLHLADVNSLFSRICKPAYPYIDLVVNFAVGDQTGNAKLFADYIVDKCNARYFAYEPLIQGYYETFI